MPAGWGGGEVAEGRAGDGVHLAQVAAGGAVNRPRLLRREGCTQLVERRARNEGHQVVVVVHRAAAGVGVVNLRHGDRGARPQQPQGSDLRGQDVALVAQHAHMIRRRDLQHAAQAVGQGERVRGVEEAVGQLVARGDGGARAPNASVTMAWAVSREMVVLERLCMGNFRRTVAELIFWSRGFSRLLPLPGETG